jgi:sugar/nucleoside kinase (ribokinase family)
VSPTVTLGVVGDLVEDVVVLLDEPIRRGADAPARILRRPGGSAANVAVAAAGLGAAVRLLTAVGDDDLGRGLVDRLAGLGVAVHAVRAGRTGTIVVVVEPDGERTMYPDRGAAATVSLGPGAVDGLRLLHLPAYGLLPPDGSPPGPGPLLAQVAAAGLALSVDVSSLQVIDVLGATLVDALTSLRPVVTFANRDEADALGWLGDEPPAGLTVVVKQGPDPALLWHRGECTEIRAEAIDDPRDSTGAGDSFAAGYLVAVLAGQDPPDAVRAGHRTAAAHLRRSDR